ncbi:MAG: N-formylglutamate amidohydrolase [Planctomycetota bacterium]
MSPRPRAFVVSAEHASARVPAQLRGLFASRTARAALASHRGSDPGTTELARDLARALHAPVFVAGASRLVCDLNRSLHHPRLFSEWTRDLDAAAKERVLARYWHPHRSAVEDAVRRGIDEVGRVVHLAVHSFTPVLDGEARTMDVAWLYDPRRRSEREFTERWRDELHALRPDLVLARNRPYRGTADGFTTHLRRHLSDRIYSGIELEVSQRLTLGPAAEWRRLRRDLEATLVAAFATSRPT